MYSPLRVRYPYVRGVLIELYREALARTGDPVDAWESIVEDPAKARAYKSLRGKGGFVRASWDEVSELIAAAHVHTIRRYGPDRIAGFSPIPAMSMVSYAAGARFLSLIGGVCLSFYDWYADLRPRRRRSGGTRPTCPSLPTGGARLRDPLGLEHPADADARRALHDRGPLPRPEGRRRLPDFAGHTKFADHWLPAQAGSDGALAMAMTHVIFKEFHVERQVPYFERYVSENTDLPCLVTLRERDGAYVTDRFLRASDLADTGENAEWKTVVVDRATGAPAVPNGSIGFRWATRAWAGGTSSSAGSSLR